MRLRRSAPLAVMAALLVVAGWLALRPQGTVVDDRGAHRCPEGVFGILLAVLPADPAPPDRRLPKECDDRMNRAGAEAFGLGLLGGAVGFGVAIARRRRTASAGAGPPDPA